MLTVVSSSENQGRKTNIGDIVFKDWSQEFSHTFQIKILTLPVSIGSVVGSHVGTLVKLIN